MAYAIMDREAQSDLYGQKCQRCDKLIEDGSAFVRTSDQEAADWTRLAHLGCEMEWIEAERAESEMETAIRRATRDNPDGAAKLKESAAQREP